MSVHHIVTAVLLFAAAVGWAFTALPDRSLAQTLPPACVLLGVGVLLAGLHSHRDRELP